MQRTYAPCERRRENVAHVPKWAPVRVVRLQTDCAGGRGPPLTRSAGFARELPRVAEIVAAAVLSVRQGRALRRDSSRSCQGSERTAAGHRRVPRTHLSLQYSYVPMRMPKYTVSWSTLAEAPSTRLHILSAFHLELDGPKRIRAGPGYCVGWCEHASWPAGVCATHLVYLATGGS